MTSKLWFRENATTLVVALLGLAGTLFSSGILYSGRSEMEPSAPRKSWLAENAVGLVTAFLGLGGAFLGAYYGATAQVDLWRKEKIYTASKDTLDKRVDLMKSIIRLNVEAQRVDMMFTVLKVTADASAYVINMCKENASKPECKDGVKPPLDGLIAIKEIADLQAQYFGSLGMAAVYFCDKTRAAVAELGKTHQNWWEIASSTRDGVVVAMSSELSCGLNFNAVLK